MVVAAGATVRLDVTLELGTTQQTIEVVANASSADRNGPRSYRGIQPAGGRTAAGSERRGAQPLRPGGHHGGSRRQRGHQLPDRRRPGRRLRHDTGRHRGHGRTSRCASELVADQLPLGGGPHGIQRGVRRLQSRNRPRLRRHDELRFQIGHQRFSRGRLRVPAQPETGRARAFSAATKAVYKQNDFGVTAGGPVWIPKMYNGRNKTFFFFSYEGFRNRVGATPHPL